MHCNVCGAWQCPTHAAGVPSAAMPEAMTKPERPSKPAPAQHEVITDCEGCEACAPEDPPVSKIEVVEAPKASDEDISRATIVRCLEGALERARAGEFDSLLVIATSAGGEVSTAWAGTMSIQEQVGMLELLKLDLHQRAQDRSGEDET